MLRNVIEDYVRYIPNCGGRGSQGLGRFPLHITCKKVLEHVMRAKVMYPCAV